MIPKVDNEQKLADRVRGRLAEAEGITVTRNDILKMNISTNADFKDLAQRLGYDVHSEEGDSFSLFAYSDKDKKYYGHKSLSGLGILLKTGVSDYKMLKNIRIANASGY